MKKMFLAFTALSLSAAPVVAQVTPQPSAEQVDGSELRGAPGAFIAPLTAVALLILGILLATETEPFDDDGSTFPVSP